MLVPVRCFTCGFCIGKVWDEYDRRKKEGEPYEALIESLGVRRSCCKRMLLSHADVASQVVHFRFKDGTDGRSTFSCAVKGERVVSAD